MKTTSRNACICTALVGVLLTALTSCNSTTPPQSTQSQPIAQNASFDKLAELPFTEGRPTPETAQTLRDELLFQRATQTYLWAMPLINTLGMSSRWFVFRVDGRQPDTILTLGACHFVVHEKRGFRKLQPNLRKPGRLFRLNGNQR